jgi:hypothetical protein
MAISVQDLDQLLGYDPASHSVAGIPSMKSAQPSAPAIPAHSAATWDPVKQDDMARGLSAGMMTQHPTIPAASASSAASAAPEIPSASTAVEGASIPALTRPTPKQSVTAGMAENATTAKQEGKNQFEQMMPQITAQPGTAEYGQQRQAQLDYKNAHPLGGDISEKPGFWGKLEHGLARAGNIAGDIFAPATMANIPGTDMNKRVQAAANANWIKLGAENQEKQAETGLAKAQTWGAMNPGAKTMAEQTAELNFRAQAAEGLGLKPGTPEYQRFVGTGAMSPNVPGKTPAEQTYDALIAQTNPTTGKPYTPQEALAEVTKAPPTNETAEDSRYEKIAADAKLGKSISPEDKAWADAYKERKALGPQASAAASAQNATLTPLLNPTSGEMLGTFNTKTGEMKPIAKPMAGATTAAGAGVGNKQTEAFNKDYVNPAEAIERSYQMFQDAYKEIQSGNAKTGAEDMLLLSQHLGTTFGQVKGSRMNKDLIQEHKDAIGIQDKIERFGNMLGSGQQLSPDQRKEFNGLITNMRNLTWQAAAKEAARNKQPIDFMPADVQVKIKAPDGSTRPIAGDRLQYYLDKGGKFAE